MKKEKYTYSFEDNSYLGPFFHKGFVGPLINILPESVRPNLITVLSGVCSFVAFIILLVARRFDYQFWFFIPFLIFLYLVGDYADGIQARKTGRCSPFGEFLDHFLDSFIPCYLAGGLLIVYGITEPVLVSVVLVNSYLTQAITFEERLKFGKMKFCKFSSTESIVLLTVFITLAKSVFLRSYLCVPFSEIIPNLHGIVGSFNIMKSILFVCSMGAMLNTVMTLIRMHGLGVKFITYMVFCIINTVLIANLEFRIEAKVVLISLYNVLYIQTILSSITAGKKESFPDFFIPLASLICYFVNFTKAFEFSVIFAYEFLAITYNLFYVLRTAGVTADEAEKRNSDLKLIINKLLKF